MLDTRQIHSMSDFLRNHKSHVARLKETRVPEVLTVNGRAEVVLLDTETYEDMRERLKEMEDMESLAYVRSVVREAKNAGPHEEVTEAEMERRRAVMKELMEETERLGLYK